MKRIKGALAFSLFLSLILMLSSCASRLSVMKYDGSNPPHLIWEDRTYVFYGYVDDNRAIGRQIGRISSVSDSRVFTVTDESPKSWLIVTDSDEMATYTLYRQETVTDIPQHLRQFKS